MYLYINHHMCTGIDYNHLCSIKIGDLKIHIHIMYEQSSKTQLSITSACTEDTCYRRYLTYMYVYMYMYMYKLVHVNLYIYTISIF